MSDLRQKCGTVLAGLVEPGAQILAAVSGGPDSMALLYILSGLRERLGLGVRVAHLNHQLRGADSDGDAIFVAEQAGKLGLEATVGGADIAQLARQGGESIELTARKERYRFLVRTAQAKGCGLIALAHTAGDQAETILHRIIRGTGLRGLAGMLPIADWEEKAGGPALKRHFAVASWRLEAGGRDLEDRSQKSEEKNLGRDAQATTLIRPLLGCTRAEVLEFLRAENIPSRHDASNDSREYTRNRLRHELLPLLREYNPRVEEALINLGRTAEDMIGMLRAGAGELLQNCSIQENSEEITLKLEVFREFSRPQQVETMHQVLEKLEIPLRDIGFRQIRGILEAVWGGNGFKQRLPAGLEVLSDGKNIFFRKVCEFSKKVEKIPEILLKNGTNPLPAGMVAFDNQGNIFLPAASILVETASAENATAHFQPSLPKSSLEEWIDGGKIAGVLRVRTWEKGESFGPLGAKGKKSLGDFFTDQKVPVELRERLVLVADETGVIWAGGLRLAERVKVTAETSNLMRLRLEVRA